MNEITNLEQLGRLILDGFTDWKSLGDVYAKENGQYILFNYTPKAVYENRWNWFERASRGLIMDTRGRIVARPFDKFFNYGEGSRYPTTDEIVRVTEKIDGSLGILYWNEYDHMYKIATRGAFDSDQAQWATDYFNASFEEYCSYATWSMTHTLLFEIIYPENRVVVDYGDRKDLVLLAIRHNVSGEYLPWNLLLHIAEVYGFTTPKRYMLPDVGALLAMRQTIDANQEGWVVEFADGSRFKFKGERYLELHRLITGLSFKRILEAAQAGTLDEVLQSIPEEFREQADEWAKEIDYMTVDIYQYVDTVMLDAPKTNRKDFAQFVMQEHKDWAPYLFARLDNKPLEPLIYKLAFRDREMEPEP